MLYSRSSEFTYFEHNWNFVPDDHHSPFPPPWCSSNQKSTVCFYEFHYFIFTYKWAYKIFVFLYLIYFTQNKVLQLYPHCQMAGFSYFLRENSFLFIDHIFFIQLSINQHLVFFFSCILTVWIMLQWIWECRYLFEILISIVWLNTSEVELLGNMIVLVVISFVFFRNLHAVFNNDFSIISKCTSLHSH